MTNAYLSEVEILSAPKAITDRQENLPHATHSYKANHFKMADKGHTSFRSENMQSSKAPIAGS